MNGSEPKSRRRLISLGELIAIAALIVSAVGVWVSWKSADSNETKTPTASEQRQPVPLVLRAKAQNDGEILEISPVEATQALQSLKIRISGAAPIDVGSDGELSANDVAGALHSHKDEPKEERLSVPVRIETRYVEAGNDRKATGTYTLRYIWRGGGLFGSRSLQLVSLSR